MPSARTQCPQCNSPGVMRSRECELSMCVVRGGTLPTALESKPRYTSPGFLVMIVGGACRSAFCRVHTRPHWSQRT